MSIYKELFRIIINHSYFRDMKCRAIDLIPTKETKLIFYNAGLLPRKSDNQLTLLYNTQYTHALDAYIKDNISFQFKITLTDPYFFNFTDITYSSDKALYLNSGTGSNQEGHPGLSFNEFVSSDDFKPLTDSIFKDNANKTETIASFIGLIEINLSSIRINSPEINQGPPVFFLNFNSKPTYWRYNIIRKNDIKYEGLSVRDSLNKVIFSEGKEITLSNGQTASQFTSKHAIALKEFPDCHFNLYGTRDNMEKLIIKDLTHPDIKYLTIEEKKNISELYIYY